MPRPDPGRNEAKARAFDAAAAPVAELAELSLDQIYPPMGDRYSYTTAVRCLVPAEA